MFDTRSKIVSVAAFLDYATSHPSQKVVAVLLDPLYGPHVRRLTEIAGDATLLVIVESPEAPLLDARARAELAASLTMVELVTTADPQASAVLRSQLGGRILDEREADETRYRELAAHVRRRNNV